MIPEPEDLELTRRERRLAEWLLFGYSNEEIGARMRTTEAAIKRAMTKLHLKTGLADRVDLALWVHEHRGELGVCCPCDWGLDPVKAVA